MPKFHHRTWALKIISHLALSLAFCAALLVPGNPDYLFPLVPESLLITGLAVSFLFYQKQQEKENSKIIAVTKHEAILLLLLLSTILFYVFPRMLVSLSETPHQVWNPCENIAPSAFVRLECYLQGAIVQFPGPRQFYMIIAAFVVGIFGFMFSRGTELGQRFILRSISLFSLIYCVVVFIGIAFGKQTLLPELLGRSTFGAVRFSLIIPNPSWVWPYLAPGLVCSLWLLISAKDSKSRITSLFSALLITFSMYKTGQRGGLLLGFALWSILGFHFTQVLVGKNRKKLIALFACLLLLPLLLALFGKQIYQSLLVGLGRTEFIDLNRFAIWKTAVPHVLGERPLFGFGYASWFQEFRSVALPAGAPLYDTAHNLFVQLIFEHGIIGAAVICSSFFGMAALSWLNNKKEKPGQTLIILSLAAFFCCTAVQEVDYIRPTFYMHALLWGALLGKQGSLEPHIGNPDKKDTQDEILGHRIIRREGVSDAFRAAAWSAGLGSVCIFLFSINYFSFGAYPFEGDLARKEERVGRWIGPHSAINSFGDSGYHWQFHIVTPQSQALIVSSSHRSCHYQANASQVFPIRLSISSKFLPLKHAITSGDFLIDQNRYISTRLLYPPTLINNSKITKEETASCWK